MAAKTLIFNADAATDFFNSNDKLINYLVGKYGEDARSSAWLAAGVAGSSTTKKSLSKYICNAVQSDCKAGTALLNYSVDNIKVNADGDEESDEEYDSISSSSLYQRDPLDLMIFNETARHILNKYGKYVQKAWEIEDAERFSENVCARDRFEVKRSGQAKLRTLRVKLEKEMAGAK